MGHHFKDSDINVAEKIWKKVQCWLVTFPREGDSQVVVEMTIPQVGVFEDPSKRLEYDYCKNHLAPKIAKVLREELIK